MSNDPAYKLTLVNKKERKKACVRHTEWEYTVEFWKIITELKP